MQLARSYLRCVLHEAAGRGRMRHVPAKIDLGLDNLPISNGQHLRVAEASSAVAMADIRYTNAIVAGDDCDEVEAVDPSAVRPAALEIGLSIDAIVERAGEVKVLGEEPLDRRAILVDIGAIASLGDFRRIAIGDGRFVRRGTWLLRSCDQDFSDAPSLSRRSPVPCSRLPASS